LDVITEADWIKIL